MNIPRPLRDYLFVRLDAAALDRTPSGLYIPDWQPGDKDARQAEVVAVPLALSDRPLPFANLDGQAYTYRDLRDLPRVGETVYLKPDTFKADLEYPGHPGVFLVPLDKVIAVGASLADGGPIVPFQGLLLCSPVYADDVHVTEAGQHVSIAESGLVEQVNELPLPFVLHIEYAGVPLAGQSNIVRAGDEIVAHKMLFAYHAVRQREDDAPGGRWWWQPATIFIDGAEYAYVPRQCVMAKST
jgi:hypothetical protein